MKNILVSLMAGVALSGSLAAAKLTNKPIAVVNGETLLLSDFQKNWEAFLEQNKNGSDAPGLSDEQKSEARRKLFDQMVDDKVLQGEARKRKIRVPQRDLENGIVQVKSRFLPENGRRDFQTLVRRQMAGLEEKEDASPDLSAAWRDLASSNPGAVKEAESAFKKELAGENLDLKKFTDRIRDQLSVVQLSGDVVRERSKPPSDKDVKDLFDKVVDLMGGKAVAGLTSEDAKDLESMAKYFTRMTGEQVHARHILMGLTDDKGQPVPWDKVSTEQKAEIRKKMEAVRKDIKAGDDFSQKAEKYSIDKGSAANGGDLGFFGRGQMVPTFEKAAFGLSEGQISDIVESPFGLHLIKLIEKKTASKLRFDQAENDLREYLYRSSQQKIFEDYVADLRKCSDIRVMVSPEELAGL